MDISRQSAVANRRGAFQADGLKNGFTKRENTGGQIPDIYKTVRRWLLSGKFSPEWKPEKGRSALTVVFLIDSSGSMAKDRQIARVKKIVTETVAANRNGTTRFAGVSLENGNARIFCPITTEAHKLLAPLAELKTGGKTNMSAAAGETNKLLRKKKKNWRAAVYIFTDGRINYCENGEDPFEDSVKKFRTMTGKSVDATVVDTETGFVKIGAAKKFAEKTAAFYMTIG